jgi:hypothetical protein
VSSVFPASVHVLAVALSAVILLWTPRLWRSTRPVASLAAAGLLLMPALGVFIGLGYGQAAVEVGVALLLSL